MTYYWVLCHIITYFSTSSTSKFQGQSQILNVWISGIPWKWRYNEVCPALLCSFEISGCKIISFVALPVVWHSCMFFRDNRAKSLTEGRSQATSLSLDPVQGQRMQPQAVQHFLTADKLLYARARARDTNRLQEPHRLCPLHQMKTFNGDHYEAFHL